MTNKSSKILRMVKEPWRIGRYLYLEFFRLVFPGHLLKRSVRGHDVQLYINPSDYGISRDLFYYGTREENAARLYLQYVRPGQVIFDLGANIGYYVCLEAGQLNGQGRVFAIEPDARNVGMLEKNIKLNNLEHIVSVHTCAIGDKSGEATLHVAAKSNLNTLRKSRYVESLNRYVGEQKVKLYTLDDFIAEQGIAYKDVSVIRMDIEGYEYEVLQGMKRLLAESKNLVMFIEIHGEVICNQHGRESYAAFIQQLSDAGLELCHAVVNLSSHEDMEVKLGSLDDLKSYHECIAVVLKKRV